MREEVNLRDVEKEILNISTKKAITSNIIAAKLLKETSDICSPALQQVWNDKIYTDNLKIADITAVMKKDGKKLALHYRAVSPLSTFSMVFESGQDQKNGPEKTPYLDTFHAM